MPEKFSELDPELEITTFENERYFKISDHLSMRPFFMSIVSDSNHWMFVSSNGGLSAGRKNPEYALFPYYTEDKITESAEITGSKTIFRIHEGEEDIIWEPFKACAEDKFNLHRNLYKSIYGNKIIFEEINTDLGLTFRYQWNSGKIFGFIRKAELINSSDKEYRITMLDGIQNIMPYGVPSGLQRSTSNLVDAYKRNELVTDSGIGIYALSAIIVDKAEPSEALKANICWSTGLNHSKILLSSLQIDRFRTGKEILEESDVKGEKGAYFVISDISLAAKKEKKWKLIANVNQTQSNIADLSRSIQTNHHLDRLIEEDIHSGTLNLMKLVAGADGLQCTADIKNDSRHFSNVLFNIMRGGVFDHNYQIKKTDFIQYLSKANKEVFINNQDFIRDLDEEFSLFNLQDRLTGNEDADLIRLATEYLPIKFSRRHGDPSRPWNYFTINIQSETDGSEILDYEGNWRDIFQNWEALACSYPDFIEGMIFKFLNASTFDGYNPYRVTKDGFDWETIEPDNPWSYIGYWGDHQIIYLQKFLEIADKYRPGLIQSFFEKECFVYAAVPYTIKPYDQILQNPKKTIDFDHEWDAGIRQMRDSLGADGALLRSGDQKIYHVNFIEKILATLLAKLSNFIPEAGIWMNTQRPEWNDANNALVGNGVSMVTLYYLHRFIRFFKSALERSDATQIRISNELIELYHSVRETLYEFKPLLDHRISDQDRKNILDRLGFAASDYRKQIYENGFWGKKRSISLKGLKEFASVCLDFTEHSIRANQREDKLFHAYNLMTPAGSGVSHTRLSEMLEGQVAVLSSGFLDTVGALDVLHALKASALFREDQYSYILYPNRHLPGFMKKNLIPAADASSSLLIGTLLRNGNRDLVEQDVHGAVHFNGNFKNADDLSKALDSLAQGEYRTLVEKERQIILDIFEKIFNHKAFTGRSGTFFAYEGLGSIYWHMVSKLLLAVQECSLRAIHENADPVLTGQLLDHYYEIEAGIGVHKSPKLYGAFPTDPYSHTPLHKGAQQPGMTGQVKEDILSRFGELGVFVRDRQLYFNPRLLRKEELLTDNIDFEYFTINGALKRLKLQKGQLAFTYCSVPVIYSAGQAQQQITVHHVNGQTTLIQGNVLSSEVSDKIFKRTGEIDRLEISVSVNA